MAGAPSSDPETRRPQDATVGSAGAALRALVVDDEAPALEELSWLLRQDDRIGEVVTASSGADALRSLDSGDIDVVFSDISMPGLDGMELARVIARFVERPQVVFVTAHDQHAVDAFAVDATDYVMKPVRKDRLAEAVRRVVAAVEPGGAAQPSAEPEDETIPVELAGVTRFITRSQVRYAQAQGDYARLHTATGSHLVRIPLSTLEERWAAAGFVRIHRSTLVSLPHVREVRMEHGRCSVVLDGAELQVSRRHTRELRDRLLRATLRSSS
ncbi:DNA-binding response regulator, LytR/AlgR family [Pedococcus dokdonensis]|uniref:DNA-binding response regulator, LytR/AlgR family n=1 Tax=Pedococcus dokdonensis TaxID=443156 RepID=A0A1H0UNE7_9MICO|nr:LytTR family DNA-binding domain-containing protein [Pedococcus dokdonensis]SDP67600.1 DNA-binding response regulator, LytR/AlgR family [Pedococcus dokdonensis]